MPGDETPQNEEQEKKFCVACGDEKSVASWKFPTPNHAEYFCVYHTYEAVLAHAAMNTDYQPLFFEAYPIHVHKDGVPSPLFLFVCKQGHIGRIFLVNREKRLDIISFYRQCIPCDDVSQDLCEHINKSVFHGKGKWQARRNLRRDISVA